MIGFLAAAMLAQTSTVPVYTAPTLPDQVLAEQRGGIRLPSGIDATWSIDTRTAVNGSVVLQTVVRVDQGSPQVAAYAPNQGENVPLSRQALATTSGGETTVSYDPRSGLTVTTTGRAGSPVIINGSAASSGKPIEGLQQIDPRMAHATDNGIIRAVGANGDRGVELVGGDISITHLTGTALGSVIANTGSDRAIDTQTTLTIDLRNAGPDVLGSSMFRVENVAIDALATRF